MVFHVRLCVSLRSVRGRGARSARDIIHFKVGGLCIKGWEREREGHLAAPPIKGTMTPGGSSYRSPCQGPPGALFMLVWVGWVIVCVDTGSTLRACNGVDTLMRVRQYVSTDRPPSFRPFFFLLISTRR